MALKNGTAICQSHLASDWQRRKNVKAGRFGKANFKLPLEAGYTVSWQDMRDTEKEEVKGL